MDFDWLTNWQIGEVQRLKIEIKLNWWYFQFVHYYNFIIYFKHRKNCKCCPVSLLIVRKQRLPWIQVFNCQCQCLNCKVGKEVPKKVPKKFQKSSKKVSTKFQQSFNKVSTKFQQSSNKVSTKFQQSSNIVPKKFRNFF